MDDRARWMDLLSLKIGVTVVFDDPWWVPIKTPIPSGTRAVVTSQKLHTRYNAKREQYADGYLGVTPITPLPGVDLCEWGGEIRVLPGLLGIATRSDSMSPLRIV